MILRERSSHRVSWAAGLCLAAAFVLALPASSSRLGADETEEGNAGANAPRIQIELQPAQAQPAAQPPAGAQAVVLDPAVLLPPQATPAPAGGAPAESDTEKRLRKLEATLEKVLQLLEAREAGPPRNATVRLGPARVSRGTTARIEARTGAATLDPEEPSAEAALPPAPPPRWAPAATARPAPPAPPARPGQPAAGAAPVPPEPPVRVTSQLSSRAWRLPNTPRPRRFDLNLEPGTLSPEKQKEVEDLVASYQDRMAKLLEEHRLALRKALTGVLDEEEIEEIERQVQPAPSTPVRIERQVQTPTPAKR